jgi:hypothetical protein
MNPLQPVAIRLLTLEATTAIKMIKTQRVIKKENGALSIANAPLLPRADQLAMTGVTV